MIKAFDILSMFEDVEPACLSAEGCAALAVHSGGKLSVGQCAELSARCVEYNAHNGTSQLCVIADSQYECDLRLIDAPVGEV